MTKRFTSVLLLIALAASAAFAQSNQVIDSLLGQPTAACAETAYMAMVGGAWLDESATPQEAFDAALSKGWLPKKAAPEQGLELDAFALLAMRAFRVKGGIGWTIFGGKRYAFRELAALGILNESGGKARIPSGEEVIRMVSQISELPRRGK